MVNFLNGLFVDRSLPDPREHVRPMFLYVAHFLFAAYVQLVKPDLHTYDPEKLGSHGKRAKEVPAWLLISRVVELEVLSPTVIDKIIRDCAY